MIVIPCLIAVSLVGALGNSAAAQNSAQIRGNWLEALKSWQDIGRKSTMLNYETWKNHAERRTAENHWKRTQDSWKTVDSEAAARNFQKWATRCAWDEAWREWQKVDHWQTAKQWFSATAMLKLWLAILLQVV